MVWGQQLLIRDGFNFTVVNTSFLCSTSPAAPVYGLFLKCNESVSDTTLLSVRNIYILFYFLYPVYKDWYRTLHYCLSGIFTFYFISYTRYIKISIWHYTIVCQEYLHFILFLIYNELGSDTTLLSVRNIYILFYFLNIMNWYRTLHYCLSGIFAFYFISYI